MFRQHVLHMEMALIETYTNTIFRMRIMDPGLYGLKYVQTILINMATAMIETYAKN